MKRRPVRRANRRLQGRYKRKAIYAAGSVGAKVGSAALSNFLYGSRPAKRMRRSRGLRRRALGAPRPQSIRVGRRGRERQSIKDLYDALGPVMHGTERFTNGPIDCNPGYQNGQFYIELSVDKVREMIYKSRDARNTFAATDETAGAVASYNSDMKFHFVGGSIKHTFKNVCNQTAYVDFYVYRPRRYTKTTPQEAWQFDLDNDNPILNVTNPIDQNMDQVDVGCRPGKTGYKFTDLYRGHRIGRRVIEPGMDVTITQLLPAIAINTALFEQKVEEVTSGADFGPFTTILGVFLNGEVITDNADAGVNYGSAKIAHLATRKYAFRAFKFVKRHQHFFTDTLDKTITNEVHYNPQDEVLHAYHEEQN